VCSEQGIDNDADLIAVLNSMALRTGIKPEDRGLVLIKKLNQVVARAKKWVDRIYELRKNLEEIRAGKGETKVDRKYFDDWLDAISEDKGFFVKATEITVSRFYSSINSMIEKLQKSEIEKQKQYGGF
jgi:hypothetical protein